MQSILNDSDQVTLNVGGHLYTTSVSTLRNAPGRCVFSAMFSGRYNVAQGPDGCVFIDRDGRYFHKILNYLRDRSFTYPRIHDIDAAGVEYLMDLRAEADYYGLQVVALVLSTMWSTWGFEPHLFADIKVTSVDWLT